MDEIMSKNYIDAELDVLVGKTIHSISGLKQYSDVVEIITECGKEYFFMHLQECCEDVHLVDFELGSDDFNSAVIISAKLENNQGGDQDHGTWSFYKIETTKGEIWMRWLGESNGSYSESVDFQTLENNTQ